MKADTNLESINRLMDREGEGLLTFDTLGSSFDIASKLTRKSKNADFAATTTYFLHSLFIN
jgi:hypothetical protein